MLGDSHSYLSQDPDWTPKDMMKNGKFGIVELLNEAKQA
jgi:hypothetical protein